MYNQFGNLTGKCLNRRETLLDNSEVSRNIEIGSNRLGTNHALGGYLHFWTKNLDLGPQGWTSDSGVLTPPYPGSASAFLSRINFHSTKGPGLQPGFPGWDWSFNQMDFCLRGPQCWGWNWCVSVVKFLLTKERSKMTPRLHQTAESNACWCCGNCCWNRTKPKAWRGSREVKMLCFFLRGRGRPLFTSLAKRNREPTVCGARSH